MTGLVDGDEGKIAEALTSRSDGTRRLAAFLPLLCRGALVLLGEAVVQLRSPLLVADPVAHGIGDTSVDANTDAVLDEGWQESRRVVHRVALKQEALVDLHVAALELDVGAGAKGLLDLGLVHEDLHPLHLTVAELAVLFTVTVAAQIVEVLVGLLQRTVEVAPAVESSGQAGQARVVLVACLDERGARLGLLPQRRAGAGIVLEQLVWVVR